jgi:hypothetical protein
MTFSRKLGRVDITLTRLDPVASPYGFSPDTPLLCCDCFCVFGFGLREVF